MDVKDYCRSIEIELNGWKTKMHYPGVEAAEHDWNNPVALITIRRIYH